MKTYHLLICLAFVLLVNYSFAHYHGRRLNYLKQRYPAQSYSGYEQTQQQAYAQHNQYVNTYEQPKKVVYNVQQVPSIHEVYAHQKRYDQYQQNNRGVLSSYYQAMSATDKLKYLWSQIVQDQSTGHVPTAQEFEKLFENDPTVTQQWEWDQIPDGRMKITHPQGAVVKVKFVSSKKNPYTGLLQGCQNGLLRFSVARSIDFTKIKMGTPAKDAYNQFVPSFAMKFFVDGYPSVNLIAMFGFNGQKSWNFFKNDFSNHLPLADFKTNKRLADVLNQFAKSTPQVLQTGIAKLALIDAYGKQVQNPNIPFKLIFKPNSQLRQSYPDEYTGPFYDQLLGIPAGTKLYTVYAIADPKSGCQQKIGYIQTTSEVTTSKYADEKLFFQHQDMVNDLELKPEWKQHVPVHNSLPYGFQPVGQCLYRQYQQQQSYQQQPYQQYA